MDGMHRICVRVFLRIIHVIAYQWFIPFFKIVVNIHKIKFITVLTILSVQVSGIKYTHIVVSLCPLSISKMFLSFQTTEPLCPLNINFAFPLMAPILWNWLAQSLFLVSCVFPEMWDILSMCSSADTLILAPEDLFSGIWTPELKDSKFAVLSHKFSVICYSSCRKWRHLFCAGLYRLVLM